MKHIHEELTCQAMPLRWFGIPRRTNSFTFKENFQTIFTDFFLKFLLCLLKSAHYTKYPRYSKCALNWFTGKESLIKYEKFETKLHTFIYSCFLSTSWKLFTYFATWLWQHIWNFVHVLPPDIVNILKTFYHINLYN